MLFNNDRDHFDFYLSHNKLKNIKVTKYITISDIKHIVANCNHFVNEMRRILIELQLFFVYFALELFPEDTPFPVLKTYLHEQ